MANIARFRTNQKKEQEGTWVDIGEGAELKLARIGNPKYQAYLMELSKPIRTALRAGNFTDPRLKDALKKVIARTVLLDWKGIEEENEKGQLEPVPYSEQKALEYMEEMPDFFTLVQELASDSSLFKDEEAEELTEGNSETS